MTSIRDRLYGQIELPLRARELALTCPVILRLREIRMANIPFLSHPSFANVDRYEHSIGVAHLAWKWSQDNHLSNSDGEALSIAALYHDGATPAYGHLFEELLDWHFGFDHEHILVELLEGRSSAGLGGESAQIFAGGSCRLRRVLPDASTSEIPSYHDIIDIVSGQHRLSKLIKGDIDLDNIDNVIRASSAMGLFNGSKDFQHPYEIVSALQLKESGELSIRPHLRYSIANWQHIRRKLYEAILSNPFEFRAQTAMKWAIEDWIKKINFINPNHVWRYTDPELTFHHLYKNNFSRTLIDRNRRGNPPELLFSAVFKDIRPIVGNEGRYRVKRLRSLIEEATNLSIYINYYVDKGPRGLGLSISDELSLFDALNSSKLMIDNTEPRSTPSGIIGAIALSPAEVEVKPLQGSPPLAGRRKLTNKKYKSMLLDAIGVEPIKVAGDWVYHKSNSKKSMQKSLFK